MSTHPGFDVGDDDLAPRDMRGVLVETKKFAREAAIGLGEAAAEEAVANRAIVDAQKRLRDPADGSLLPVVSRSSNPADAGKVPDAYTGLPFALPAVGVDATARAALAQLQAQVNAIIAGGVVADPWPTALTAWKSRKPLTIVGSQIPGALTDFPLMVDLSAYTDIAAKAKADRSDLRFADAAGNPLVHQWVNVDPSIVLGDAMWSWYTGPRVAITAGKLFFAFVTGRPPGTGDAYRGGVGVGSIDLSTGAVATTLLATPFAYDDHNNPSILVRSDGRIVAFWSDHNGATLFYAVSTAAGSIASFQTTQTLTTFTPGTSVTSYPKPHRLSGESNRVYMSRRDGEGRDGRASISYTDDLNSITSGAATWSPSAKLIDSVGRAYVVSSDNGVDRIDYLTTDGHPDEVNTNVSHFYLQGGQFRRTDGTIIRSLAAVMAGTPLAFSELTPIHVYSSANGRGWTWDVRLGADGKPVAVYDVMPGAFSADGSANKSHTYRYAKWSGTAWVVSTICDGGGPFPTNTGDFSYSGGVSIDPDDTSTVIVSRQIAAQHEIERRTTPDGSTWPASGVTTITQGSDRRQVRPILPAGRPAGCPQVLWIDIARYDSYFAYSSRLRCWPALTVPPALPRTRARVKIPSLAAGTDRKIYVYYANPAAPLPSEGQAVWKAGTLAVFGGDGDPSGFAVRELTGRPNNPVRRPSASATFADGLNGRALSMDGTQTARVYGDPVALNGVTNLVLQGWIKRVGTGLMYIMGNWVSPTAKAAFMVRNSAANKLEAYVIVASDTQIGGVFADLNIGTVWHHFAVSLDPVNGLRGYLDGVLSTTTFATTAAMDADPATNSVVLGSIDTAAGNRWNGLLSDLRIHNVAVDPAEFLMQVRASNTPGAVLTAGQPQSL